MNILSRALLITVASLSVTLSSSAVARTPQLPPSALQIVEAVWKVQSLSFAYSGYATVYSCDALIAKVRVILQSLGARKVLRIRSSGCMDMVTHGRMDIALESPVEATPENIEALTTYDTRAGAGRAGAQRATGSRGRGAALRGDVEDRLHVARNRLELGPSDCELVEQLSRNVLPRMAIRVERDRLRCSVAFGNIGPPQLRPRSARGNTGEH